MSTTPRWRAPRQDGAILADPPLAEAGRLLADNRRRLAAPTALLGRPLAELRSLARREALGAATDYLRRAGEPVPSGSATSLVLAGHQPELFHPGVWVKNFALHGIARQHGCTPLNLVVDNDTAKTNQLLVPAIEGRTGAVYLGRLSFDDWQGELPFEELTVRNTGTFTSFGATVAASLEPWHYPSMVTDFWAEVLSQAARTPLLGERFAAARRTFERRWDCLNFEVPLSALCRTEAFAWFAGHILNDVPRFHAAYNAVVQEYRRQHGIRSRNHPVPDLARDGDWYEVPFWAWRTGERRRGRLFVRPGDRLELRAGNAEWPTLPRCVAGVSAWRDLEQQGLKVRTRALTTTLFSRLLLADLFIHGIGGGIYDELTDELMRRFFQCEPPGYLVLSATLLLPLPVHPVQPAQRRRLAHDLHDLPYNPQRHLNDGVRSDPQVRALVQRKQELIALAPADRKGRRQRCHDIRAVNEALRPYIQEEERAGREMLAALDRQLRENAIFQQRDYAFCLFPETKLRPFCERFLRLDLA